MLQDAYKRVLDSPLWCEAILVHGESGTGKTILVQRSFQPQQDNGTLVSGKFDIIHSQKPYSAVVDALTQLCSTATWANISNEEALRAYAIKRLHASDLKILCKLVPAVGQRLSSLVVTNDGDESDSDSSSDVSNDTSFAFARFTKIVRSFVYVVARFLPSPLILFLDDVQAADAESLSLIASLTSRHSDSCNVLLILAYRDNEQNLNPERVLAKNTAFDVTDIKINNFDANNMNKLIAKMLRMDPEITIPFSTLVNQRTGGIIYHALQFLDVLRNERLLVYHFERCCWEWDVDKIRSTTNVTDNVAALLTSKIQQLSSGVQLAVQLAACLGFYFDIGFLERMVRQERVCTVEASKDCRADNNVTRETSTLSVDEGHDSISFSQAIAIAVEENLINQAGGLKYKFTHDRVLQAAYEMNPAGQERDMLHWRIGRLLWMEHQKQYAELQGVTDEWLLFAAADQLNRGSDCGLTMADVVSSLDLARLNLDAGKAALEKSAFQHAAGFFDKGVKLIHDSWQEEYLLCLELHTFSAETNHAVSNFETCDRRISEILSNGRCLEDKLRAYLVKVKSLGVRGMVQKALDESSVVLKLLGSRISRRPNLLQMLWEITKTKRALKVQTIDFASLPDMTSPLTIIWAVKFLHMYAIFAFFAGHLPGGVVSVRRMVDLTIKYGVSSQGPFVVATYGALLSVMGEFQAAYQAGRDAYELTKRPHSTGRAEATATVFAFLNHLREPLIRSFDHFMDGYNNGMKSGEIEGAAGCLSGYATLGTYLGKNLEIVKSEMEGFHQAYHNEIKNNFSMIILLPHHQFTLNMMGPCENPLILTGEIMRAEDYLEEVQKTGNNFAKSTYAIVRMVLLYIFCEFDLACTELPNLDLGNRGLHFATPFAHMFSALTLLAMARKTRKPKYAWRAAGNIRYLRKMAKAGNLNVPPLLELVSAEQASLRRGCSPEDVKSAYESAVRVASRSGFSVIEAIRSERAGEYMQSIGDMFWAEIFLSRAYRLYDEWGAAMKTQQMMKKYNMFLAESENLSMSNRSISLSLGKRNSQRRASERRRLSVMD